LASDLHCHAHAAHRGGPRTMPPTVHDSLFKSTFSDPRHAEGALRAALPEALSARIAWETLETVPGSFVDSELRDRHTDLLYRVSLSGRQSLLYVLYEHQSTPHPLMPLRLVAYCVRIWEQWLRESPETRTLPAILPVVLYHGRYGAGAWSAARSLEELYDLDEETSRAAADHLLRMRFVLDDLTQETDADLRARAATALSRLVVSCLRRARTPEAFVSELGAWSDVALEVLASPNGAAALGTVWRYVIMVHPGEPEVVLQQLTDVMKEQRVKESLMTAGEILMQRGEARGEARGERRLLEKQLTLRFGPLPAGTLARLEAADVPTLDAWGERVLTARTLEELFG